MASLKEVKNRINSVKSTRQITSAMKMVASAKLHKAQGRIENMLPYQHKLNGILANFLATDSIAIESPYTEVRPVNTVALVVFSSSTSLCGAFNSNVLKQLEKSLQKYQALPKENIHIYPVGKKIEEAVKKLGFTPQGSYQQMADKPSYEEAYRLAEELMDAFARKEVDSIELIYHHFKSMGTQTLVCEPFLPIDLDELAKAGRGELTRDQARQEALRYLDEANDPWQWEPLADQEGYGCSYPKSAKELRQSREALKKAIATGCADEDVAEDINMLILLHNRASGLIFNGWFPFVLVAFIAIIAMPIIKGDFWHMVLSWQYLGYWAGLAAYIIASMAFRSVALRGKPVEELDTMKDKVANMTGATVAGAVAVGGAAVGLLGFLSKQLEWALDHSITHYRVFRNGVHVGNTSEMNPTGLVYFAIVIVALLVLLYIAWSIVMLILQFAAIYKFMRNYLIRR